MKRNGWALIVLFALGVACGGGGGGHGGGGGSAPPPRPPAPPLPTPTGEAVIPRTATAPFGLTWHIGINNNVSAAEMQAWYAKMAAMAADLWNVSEGQVYIAKVVIIDAVAPGHLASDAMPPAAAMLDMVVYVGTTWDVPYGGFVSSESGRAGRIIGVPDTADPIANIHECSHMIFDLSWDVGDLLVDEYADGTQDDACIMDLAFASLRWCGADNHVTQSTQPTSCWQQILADYPNFTYAGTNTAATAAPAVEVEYSDTP